MSGESLSPFDLDGCITTLGQKRASLKRESTLQALVDYLENSSPSIAYPKEIIDLLNNLMKKGPVKEALLATRAIGLIGVVLGPGLMAVDLKDVCLNGLSGMLNSWSNESTMTSAMATLSVVAFVSSNNMSEIEAAMKVIWKVIKPQYGTNVNVRVHGRHRPTVLAAAISAWAFLLSSISSLESTTSLDYLRDSMEYLYSLLKEDDSRVQVAAGKSLALCVELNLVTDSYAHTGEDSDASSSSIELLSDKQSLRDRVLDRAVNLAMNAEGKFADNKQKELFEHIVEYLKCGRFREEMINISHELDVVRVNSWSKLIQIHALKQILGSGFLKHMKDNRFLQKVFSIEAKSTQNPSTPSTEETASGEIHKTVCLIYDERMLGHIPPVGCDCAEKPERITSIYEKLKEDNLLKWCKTYKAQRVNNQHLFSVHGEYYSKVMHDAYTMEGKQRSKYVKKYFSHEMYFSEGTAEAALSAAGGVVKACDLVARGLHDKAFAIVRPPGHHAKHEYASGFCFLNNVAIGAKYLLREHKSKKVLIVDWDMHHGNGTQEIFYKDRNVLYFSLHRLDTFPQDKSTSGYIGAADAKGFNINFGWSHTLIQDDDFFAVWDYLLLPIAREFSPDMVLISAGFDAAEGDPLGKCSVTPQGYATLLKRLLDATNGKTIMVLEGGYNNDAIARSASACVKVLTGDESETVGGSEQYTPYCTTLNAIVLMRKKLKLLWPTALRDDIPQDVLDRHIPPPRPRNAKKAGRPDPKAPDSNAG